MTTRGDAATSPDVPRSGTDDLRGQDGRAEALSARVVITTRNLVHLIDARAYSHTPWIAARCGSGVSASNHNGVCRAADLPDDDSWRWCRRCRKYSRELDADGSAA